MTCFVDLEAWLALSATATGRVWLISGALRAPTSPWLCWTGSVSAGQSYGYGSSKTTTINHFSSLEDNWDNNSGERKLARKCITKYKQYVISIILYNSSKAHFFWLFIYKYNMFFNLHISTCSQIWRPVPVSKLYFVA